MSKKTKIPVKVPRIATLDIETAPISGLTWQVRKAFIPLDFIQRDWSIMSYTYKWLGDDAIHYADNRKQRDPRNDTKLLRDLYKLLDTADIIVAQNGDRFDLPRIKARLIEEGYQPPSPFKTVDTLLQASKFGFTSKRLAYLSKVLTPQTVKSEHKKFPGNELWLACLNKDIEAWEEMRAYNIQDVIATEQVYLKLLAWDNKHPNVAAYVDDDTLICGRCGSTDLRHTKKVLPTNVGSYPLYQCNSCGGWSKGRHSLNTKNKRTALLTGV